jgi:predicted SAM-dependent methyltransferase
LARSWLRSAFFAVIRVVLRGDRHECPCCGGRFRRFVARQGSLLCPRCRSRERQRVLWLYLCDEVGLTGKRVLHLAPEEALARRLRTLPGYETADLEPGPLVDRTVDARALPHADGSFDVILCSHVLEHIEEDVHVVKEFARVLAPGGLALVQVPVDRDLAATYDDPTIVEPDERARAFGQSDHVRVYAADVIDRLRAGGLEVRCVAYDQERTAAERERYVLTDPGPFPGADIYRCAKPR